MHLLLSKLFAHWCANQFYCHSQWQATEFHRKFNYLFIIWVFFETTILEKSKLKLHFTLENIVPMQYDLFGVVNM